MSDVGPRMVNGGERTDERWLVEVAEAMVQRWRAGRLTVEADAPFLREDVLDRVRPVTTALRAIVERFEANDDPRDWPAEVREAAELLRGRRA